MEELINLEGASANLLSHMGDLCYREDSRPVKELNTQWDKIPIWIGGSEQEEYIAVTDCAVESFTHTSDLLSYVNQIIDRIQFKGVLVPNPILVNRYLSKHYDIIELIEKVVWKVREAFGEQIILSLEMYSDPEIEDSYLVFYVRMPIYDDNIMDKIEAVNSTFEERLTNKSGWFIIATDFNPLQRE